MRALDDAITLDKVHALERDVEARILGIAKEHEFAAPAVRLDLAQTLELPDTVIHVHNKVAGLQLGKVAEEAGGADFSARAVESRSDLEEISVAVQGDLCFGKGRAVRERRAHEQQPGGFLRRLGGESGGGILGFAEDVRDFVLAANICQAFEFSGAGGGEENAAARGYLRFHFAHAGDDIAVKAGARPRR